MHFRKPKGSLHIALPIPRPEDPFQYHPPIYTYVFQVVYFIQVFQPKNRVCTLRAHLILLDLST